MFCVCVGGPSDGKRIQLWELVPFVDVLDDPPPQSLKECDLMEHHSFTRTTYALERIVCDRTKFYFLRAPDLSLPDAINRLIARYKP